MKNWRISFLLFFDMVYSFPSYLSLNISKLSNFELQTRNFHECSRYRFADWLKSRTLEKDEIVLSYVTIGANACAVPVKRLRIGIQKLVLLMWIFHRSWNPTWLVEGFICTLRVRDTFPPILTRCFPPSLLMPHEVLLYNSSHYTKVISAL